MYSHIYYLLLIIYSLYLFIKVVVFSRANNSDKYIIILFTLFVISYSSLMSLESYLFKEYISIFKEIRCYLLGICVGVGLSMWVTGVISRLK